MMTEPSFPVVAVSDVGGENVQTVDARDLHAFLEVGTAFKDWISRRVNEYGFEDGTDFCSYLGESGGGRPAKEYAISLDMAKELAMVENNDQGRQVRRYFIRMERQAKNPALSLNDPATLRKLLLGSVDRVMLLEQTIEADKPKTTFYDQFINTDGLYTLQNAGRALECHPNLFIRWLKSKYLFYQGAALVPYVQYRQSGIFEQKSEIWEGKARLRTYVTAKGVEHLAAKVPAEVKIGDKP